MIALTVSFRMFESTLKINVKNDPHLFYIPQSLLKGKIDWLLNNGRRKEVDMASTGIMMAHVLFGVLGTLLAAALFVDLLNLNAANVHRIQRLSLGVAAFIVIAYLVGGYWYVVHYAPDKAVILAGSWPWAHKYFMEVKEHLFFTLILLCLYLPIVVYRLSQQTGLRKLALTITGLIVLLGLTMDGFGAIIAMGVRMGLAGVK